MIATNETTGNSFASGMAIRQSIPAAAEEEISAKDSSRFPAVDWPLLVEQIKAGHGSGLEHLYKLFSRGIRYYLCRQVGPQELEDKLHDTFLIVVYAIQKGDLREPERLMGFVRTIVRRQVAAHIDEAVQNRKEYADLEMGAKVVDKKGNPEQRATSKEKMDLLLRVLKDLSERDREILTRAYLEEQPQGQICLEMGLTETQFRLLKSRAKARLGETGKKKLARGGRWAFSVRKSGS